MCYFCVPNTNTTTLPWTTVTSDSTKTVTLTGVTKTAKTVTVTGVDDGDVTDWYYANTVSNISMGNESLGNTAVQQSNQFHRHEWDVPASKKD